MNTPLVIQSLFLSIQHINIPYFFNSIDFYVRNLGILSFIQTVVSYFLVLIGIVQILKTAWSALAALRSKIDKQGILKGKKYLYHLTRYKDNIVSREIELEFDKNWKNQLIIKGKDREKLLDYKGYVKGEGNHLIFMIETVGNDILGNKEKEEIQLRFYKFSRVSQDIEYGLWVGRDLNTHPACGVRLMSRFKLSETEVRELINKRTIAFEELGLLQITDYVYEKPEALKSLTSNPNNMFNNDLDEEKIEALLKKL
jgi:hypothetical protein